MKPTELFLRRRRKVSRQLHDQCEAHRYIVASMNPPRLSHVPMTMAGGVIKALVCRPVPVRLSRRRLPRHVRLPHLRRAQPNHRR